MNSSRFWYNCSRGRGFRKKTLYLALFASLPPFRVPSSLSSILIFEIIILSRILRLFRKSWRRDSRFSPPFFFEKMKNLICWILRLNREIRLFIRVLSRNLNNTTICNKNVVRSDIFSFESAPPLPAVPPRSEQILVFTSFFGTIIAYKRSRAPTTTSENF